MKCKPLISSLAVVMALVCVLLGNVSASAHTAMPAASYNCNNQNCFADQIWNGTTNGGGVQFTVDKPGFVDSVAYYNKYIYLKGQAGSESLAIGEARTKSNTFPASTNYCGGSNSSILWNYFIYAKDSHGLNATARCFPIPAGDENHLTYISAISGTDCEGDGLYDDLWVTIRGFVSNFTDCAEAELTFAYSSIDDKMQWYGTVQDHMVWGGHWYNSDWVDSNYSLRGQTRLPDTLDQHQPPQQYWNTIPSNNLPGGDLWSCVYASGVTCTQGG